jgi:hypothetical protein
MAITGFECAAILNHWTSQGHNHDLFYPRSYAAHNARASVRCLGLLKVLKALMELILTCRFLGRPTLFEDVLRSAFS